MIGTIYVITNNVNDKAYVGYCSTSLAVRWRNHLYASKTGEESALYRAMRAHGTEKFHIISIWSGPTTREHLKQIEQYYVASLSSQRPRGYNLTRGGDGPIHSEEFKAKLAESNRTRVWTDEMRAKHAALRLGKPSVGHACSPETREKMRGNKYFLGRKHTQATIQKMKDRWTDDVRRKKSIAVKLWRSKQVP